MLYVQVLRVTFATIEVYHNVHWEQRFQVPTSDEAISCIFACTQSGYHAEEDVERGGDHSLEDLAKSGYIYIYIYIKYESLVIRPYISYTLKSKYRHPMILAFFPPNF
jgi:hypothetical protein